MAFVTEKEKKKELKNNISNYMKLLFRRSVEEATPQQLMTGWQRTKPMRKRM